MRMSSLCGGCWGEMSGNFVDLGLLISLHSYCRDDACLRISIVLMWELHAAIPRK